jgi:hypothetical protein
MSGIRDATQRDLKEAMKARDRVRLSALRGALSAISNAEAVDARVFSECRVVRHLRRRDPIRGVHLVHASYGPIPTRARLQIRLQEVGLGP